MPANFQPDTLSRYRGDIRDIHTTRQDPRPQSVRHARVHETVDTLQTRLEKERAARLSRYLKMWLPMLLLQGMKNSTLALFRLMAKFPAFALNSAYPKAKKAAKLLQKLIRSARFPKFSLPMSKNIFQKPAEWANGAATMAEAVFLTMQKSLTTLFDRSFALLKTPFEQLNNFFQTAYRQASDGINKAGQPLFVLASFLAAKVEQAGERMSALIEALTVYADKTFKYLLPFVEKSADFLDAAKELGESFLERSKEEIALAFTAAMQWVKPKLNPPMQVAQTIVKIGEEMIVYSSSLARDLFNIYLKRPTIGAGRSLLKAFKNTNAARIIRRLHILVAPFKRLLKEWRELVQGGKKTLKRIVQNILNALTTWAIAFESLLRSFLLRLLACFKQLYLAIIARIPRMPRIRYPNLQSLRKRVELPFRIALAWFRVIFRLFLS